MNFNKYIKPLNNIYNGLSILTNDGLQHCLYTQGGISVGEFSERSNIKLLDITPEFVVNTGDDTAMTLSDSAVEVLVVDIGINKTDNKIYVLKQISLISL